MRGRLVTIMGPLHCASCGAFLTEGDPRHPLHGPVDGPTPGCGACDKTVALLGAYRAPGTKTPLLNRQGGVTTGDSHTTSRDVTGESFVQWAQRTIGSIF